MKPRASKSLAKPLTLRVRLLLLLCLTAAQAVLGQSPTVTPVVSLDRAETLAAKGDIKAAITIYEGLLDPSQPTFVRRGALGALLQLDEANAEQRILRILRAPDPTLKPVAIAAVGSLPSPDASKKLGEEMPRLQPAEQIWLVEALAGRGDADARSAIRTAVGSEHSTVRLAAIGAVGELDDAASVPLLARALTKTKDSAERRGIELAFASLKGGVQADQALIAELKTAFADSKRPLISSLVRRRSQVAVPVLVEEAGGSDPVVVSAAFDALGKLAPVGDLTAVLKALTGLQVSEARTGAESAVGELLSRLEDAAQCSEAVRQALVRTPEVEARCSLLRLLPACADAKGFAALEAAREDQSPRLRGTAVRALAEWPDATAWAVLADIYRQPETPSYRLLALRALTRIAEAENAHPTSALIDRYRQLFAGVQTDGDRKLILGALAGVAHPDALQLALPFLENAQVHTEAALAVKKIAEAIQAQYPQVAQDALQRLK